MRRARAPGIVYAGLAVALVAVLAAIALTTRQPPPPTIAEFAPQAVEQIKTAPQEQSSNNGSAPGEGGGSAATSRIRAVAAKQVVVDVPRVRHCVGNPPRQIEDPQSPPCVPFWTGDNGGATARGVTRDEVRVMIPTDKPVAETLYSNLEAFFNSRFEFYGRRLKFEYLRNDVGSSSPAVQKADAIATADQHRVFASTFYRSAGGYYYSEELARRKVIAVTGLFASTQRSYLQRYAPYMWQYWMDADGMFAGLGDWACRRLAGRNASFTTAPLDDAKRVFGIVMQTSYDADETDSTALEQRLAACGQKVPASRKARNEVRGDPSGESGQAVAVDPVSATNVVVKMKQAGVTTFLCTCTFWTGGALMKAATGQEYYPEWVFTTYAQSDRNTAATQGTWPAEQARHAFGVTFQPRQLRPDNEPYRWAMKEVDPAYTDDGTSASVGLFTADYRAMLAIASGIQMAGPHLTPATFAAGLRRTTFPNPAHPNMEGDVGFGGGSYTMTLDGAEFWFSPGGPTPFSGSDAVSICYPNGGRRYRAGAWPHSPPALFTAACDSGR